jgi:hypothetical protein
MGLLRKNGPMRNLTWIVAFLLVFAILVGNPAASTAQTQVGDWAPPVNLSRSGGAFNPSVVIDANGSLHMIWADAFAGFVYSFLSEDGWSVPKPVLFPFSPPRNTTIGPDFPTPVMFTDQRNRIHAFWIDGSGVLYHSSVFALYVDSPGSWTGRRVIADAAITMDVVSDENGNIHVAYIRNLISINSPAGLYYRSLDTNSYVWSLPTLLDESPYFRSLDLENANVSMASTWVDDTVQLMIGWDNRPRNRISLIKSVDNGVSWGDVMVIEGPEVSTNPVNPFNILVGLHERNTILVWQEDEPGDSCNQVFQHSNDGGETWVGKQRMLTNLQGCAEDYQFLIRADGQMILMTRILGQIYFQAWDGQRWSDPQLQNILSSFIDQETFNLVDLGCQFAFFTQFNELYIAGCDRGIGGDVWLTSRKIESVSNWFPSDTNWSIPVNLARGSAIALSSSMVSDEASVHVIWGMVENQSDEGAELRYARSDGANWSSPQIVFGPPVHYVGDTALAIDTGQLYAAWNDQSTGEILVASAPADRASNPREWSRPVSIPLPREEGKSPAIQADSDGSLYIAYALPINEQRGIYISRSNNRGRTWSEPNLVFDAVAANWPMVDHPKFTISADGTIHLIFSRYGGNNRPAGLYYVVSVDGGATWSEVDVVSEVGVGFSDIIEAGNGMVHVLWVESGSTYSLWHAYFDDPDRRWDTRRTVQNSITEPKASPLLEDAAGGIHLLQLSNETSSELTLKHWVWVEPQWNVAELYPIQVDSDLNANELLGTISPKGQMIAVYTFPIIDTRVNVETISLFSVARVLDIYVQDSFAQPAGDQEETVIPLIDAPVPTTEITVPTPATAMIVDEYRPDIDTAPVDRPNQWIGLAIGIVVGGGLTVFILVLAVRSVRRRGMN